MSEQDEETTEEMVAYEDSGAGGGDPSYIIVGQVLEDAPVAESAESDDDDEDAAEEETTEPEPAPSEEEVNAQAQIVKMQKYGERARKYLAKNMADTLGEQADDFLECPFCNFTDTPGFLHASPCPPELMATVSEWAFGTVIADLKPDNYSRQCDTCGGEGRVNMRSNVPEQKSLACIDCVGKGWVAVGPERSGNPMYVSNGAAQAVMPPSETSAELFAPPADEDPEAAALRAKGYIVMPPIGVGS